MPVADPSRIGSRIADARRRASLTQAELAAAVSLDRPALTKIEGGSRRVSAVELAAIADALSERIEWFVMEPPAAIVSHRNLQEPGAPSPVIDREIERAVRNVEFLLAHDDAWQLNGPVPLERPATIDEAEQVASQARALLGLDTEEPVLGLAGRAERIGLLPFSVDLGTETADAASILLPRGGVAMINGRLHVGRRRLALAHELGHYLFADDYSVDWRLAQQEDGDAWETRLDRFARAVLLPAQGVQQAWEELREAELRVGAVILASRFRVDMSTLGRRLFELRLIDRQESDRIRSVRTTKADIVELNLVVHHELTAPSLPHTYAKSVLALYRQETISSARALDLLLDTWEEADLPALPRLPESAIWQFIS